MPELKGRPIIIGESDPEGCAACSARVYPAERVSQRRDVLELHGGGRCRGICDLAAKHGVNLLGAVTWAFEFEDQPYFDGFRDLATNGIDKPVLNVFRMLGMMAGNRVAVESSAAATLDRMLAGGVKDRARHTRHGEWDEKYGWRCSFRNYHDSGKTGAGGGDRPDGQRASAGARPGAALSRG